jgi:hypothetical protein
MANHCLSDFHKRIFYGYIQLGIEEINLQGAMVYHHSSTSYGIDGPIYRLFTYEDGYVPWLC